MTPIELPEFREPTQFALTPDGRAVITASDAGELTWWDLLTGQQIRTLEIAPGQEALALSPDGRTVAVGIDESVQLVDVGTGDVKTATAGLPASPNWLRFSPDGANPRVGERRRDRDRLGHCVGDSPATPCTATPTPCSSPSSAPTARRSTRSASTGTPSPGTSRGPAASGDRSRSRRARDDEGATTRAGSAPTAG